MDHQVVAGAGQGHQRRRDPRRQADHVLAAAAMARALLDAVVAGAVAKVVDVVAAAPAQGVSLAVGGLEDVHASNPLRIGVGAGEVVAPPAGAVVHPVLQVLNAVVVLVQPARGARGHLLPDPIEAAIHAGQGSDEVAAPCVAFLCQQLDHRGEVHLVLRKVCLDRLVHISNAVGAGRGRFARLLGVLLVDLGPGYRRVQVRQVGLEHKRAVQGLKVVQVPRIDLLGGLVGRVAVALAAPELLAAKRLDHGEAARRRVGEAVPAVVAAGDVLGPRPAQQDLLRQRLALARVLFVLERGYQRAQAALLRPRAAVERRRQQLGVVQRHRVAQAVQAPLSLDFRQALDLLAVLGDRRAVVLRA